MAAVPMIFVLATLTVNAAEREAFTEAAHAVIEATRKETGCLRYDLTGSITDPLTFVFVEQWESRDALDAHFGTPHLQHWRKLCERFLASRRVEVIRPEHVDVL
jgi:quinol monooxygenase YgiN